MMTCWLLPGSLTVANCSSLYFSTAGPSFDIRPGSDAVRDWMSAITSASGGTIVYQLLLGSLREIGRHHRGEVRTVDGLDMEIVPRPVAHPRRRTR
jgi:hypothetical protein